MYLAHCVYLDSTHTMIQCLLEPSAFNSRYMINTSKNSTWMKFMVWQWMIGSESMNVALMQMWFRFDTNVKGFDLISHQVWQGSPKYGPWAGSGQPRSFIQPAMIWLKSLLMIGTTNFEPQLDIILSETHQFQVSRSREKPYTVVLHHNLGINNLSFIHHITFMF